MSLLPMVTAAVMLFYLSAIPVHIAFQLHTGADRRFKVGISIFEPRFAMRHALTAGEAFKPPKLPKKLHLSDALVSAKTVLRHIKIDLFRLDGVFGTDDAAVTALVCGGVSSMGCALQCILGRGVRIHLQPDFSSDRLRVDMTGMISMRAGHIMIAALLGAFQYGSRRFKEWTSIPSKAS